MVNGRVNFCFGALDFGFQRRNPLAQFLDGKRIEILPLEGDQGIGDTLRKEIIDIHAGKVDPLRALVNKQHRKTRRKCNK